MNKGLLIITLRNTALAALYIFLVSQIMQNGSKLFGTTDSEFTPFVVLLLFCFSSAVVGGLVFGKSLFLFLDNKKEESVKAAIYSVGWLGVYTVLGFIALYLTK